MDFRGQGESEVTRSGYDLDTLADDVIALIEHLMTGPSASPMTHHSRHHMSTRGT